MFLLQGLEYRFLGRLAQRTSIWGMHAPRRMRRHLRGYEKTSYIDQNDTGDPFET
jgi:hypothetical protein